MSPPLLWEVGPGVACSALSWPTEIHHFPKEKFPCGSYSRGLLTICVEWPEAEGGLLLRPSRVTGGGAGEPHS